MRHIIVKLAGCFLTNLWLLARRLLDAARVCIAMQDSLDTPGFFIFIQLHLISEEFTVVDGTEEDATFVIFPIRAFLIITFCTSKRERKRAF